MSSKQTTSKSLVSRRTALQSGAGVLAAAGLPAWLRHLGGYNNSLGRPE